MMIRRWPLFNTFTIARKSGYMSVPTGIYPLWWPVQFIRPRLHFLAAMRYRDNTNGWRSKLGGSYLLEIIRINISFGEMTRHKHPWINFSGYHYVAQTKPKYPLARVYPCKQGALDKCPHLPSPRKIRLGSSVLWSLPRFWRIKDGIFYLHPYIQWLMLPNTLVLTIVALLKTFMC